MKKILFVLLVIIATFILCSCGISRDDYDSLQGNYDSLEWRYNELQDEYDSLGYQYDDLVDRYNSLVEDYNSAIYELEEWYDIGAQYDIYP